METECSADLSSLEEAAENRPDRQVGLGVRVIVERRSLGTERI
jgi:hypothetical protein